jgi:hypothetical protein
MEAEQLSADSAEDTMISRYRAYAALRGSQMEQLEWTRSRGLGSTDAGLTVLTPATSETVLEVTGH